MPTINVQVTAADIENGTATHPQLCPVALALNRVTGEAWIVLPCAGYRAEDYPAHPTALPARVRQWIISFDRTRRAKPLNFKFKLKAP